MTVILSVFISPTCETFGRGTSIVIPSLHELAARLSVAMCRNCNKKDRWDSGKFLRICFPLG